MTELERLDALTDAAVRTIQRNVPFDSVRAAASNRQLQVVTTNGYVPLHECDAHLEGIRMGKACIVQIMKTANHLVQGLQLPVQTAEDVMVETWNTGRRSIFVSPDGEIVLFPDWQSSNIEVIKRVLSGRLNIAASGDLLGFVYDLDGTILAYGNYPSIEGCHTKEEGPVAMLVKPNVESLTDETPVIIGVRVDLHMLTGSAHRIVKA